MKLKIIIMITCLMVLIACSLSKNQMIILTEEYPPLSYTENDSIKGYAYDIVQLIQDEMNTHYPIQVLKWNEAYKTALSKENVVIFTLEKTHEREDLFYWIGPIGSNTTSFYTRNDNTFKVNNLYDLKNLKSIATTTDWYSEQFLKKEGFSNLMSLPNPEDNVKMLMKAKVDATLLSDLTAPFIIKRASYTTTDLKQVYTLMESSFYIGISRKTNYRLVKKWENAFMKIKAQGLIDTLAYQWQLKN